MTLSQGRNSPEPSYHTLEVDEREWTRKGCYLPRGERFSTKESDHIPPSAPGTAASGPSPVEQKLGQANTIERAINQHSMKYSVMFNSAVPLRPEPKLPQYKTIGPGQYNLPGLASKEPWRLSSGFSSGSLRLARPMQLGSGPSFSTTSVDVRSWQKGINANWPRTRRFEPPKKDYTPGPGAYISLQQWRGKPGSLTNSLQPVYSVPHSV